MRSERQCGTKWFGGFAVNSPESHLFDYNNLTMLSAKGSILNPPTRTFAKTHLARASRLPRVGDRRPLNPSCRRPSPPSLATLPPERVAGTPHARKEGGIGAFPPRTGGAGWAQPSRAVRAARWRGPPSAPPGGAPTRSGIAMAGFGVPRRSGFVWWSDGCRPGGGDGGPWVVRQWRDLLGGAFRPVVGGHFVGRRGLPVWGARWPVGGALQRRPLCVAVPCGCVVVGGGQWGEEASDVWRLSVGWRRRRWASRICGVAACIPVGGDLGGGGLLLGGGVGGQPFPN
jgi:hypothetical protein